MLAVLQNAFFNVLPELRSDTGSKPGVKGLQRGHILIDIFFFQ